MGIPIKRVLLYLSLTASLCTVTIMLMGQLSPDNPDEADTQEIQKEVEQQPDSSQKDEESEAETPLYQAEDLPQWEDPFKLKEDDWNRYIWQKRRLSSYNTNPPRESFVAEGIMMYRLGYGHSEFTKKSYKTSDISTPQSRVIDTGVNQERLIRMHVEGQVNDRLRVLIHHDSEADENDNMYIVEYKAIEDDEVLREAHIGNILVSVNNSKYAVYDSGTRRALGFDTTFRKDDLTLKMFGSVFQSQSEVEYFKGAKSAEEVKLKEYQYVKNTYYQIEPFIRYDGRSTAPNMSAGSNIYESAVTFTSSPESPATYRPSAVNIKSGSFALYYDDQIMTNNAGTSTLSLDGGSYAKLSAGSDYRIDYTSGTIKLLFTPLAQSRIYAVYSLTGGRSSADPSSRQDIVEGKNFVFIKYGTTISEDADHNYSWDGDRNGDGRINYDIYEIRSVYFTGTSKISEEDFSLTFMKNQSELSTKETNLLGKYKIEYSTGRILFYLREPFRQLLDEKSSDILYSETIGSDAYRYSNYSLYINYYSDDRAYQLKHTNIAEESVTVKVNNKRIDSSAYTVNSEEGILEFKDPNSPYIGDNTDVEISYEYAPFGGGENAFLGGVRADYYVNHNLSVGGTILYSSSPTTQTIPTVGNEPESNLVLEADSTVYFGPAKLKRLASSILGRPVTNLPFDYRGYFEIAHSRLQTNTFDKAMVEDMEESEEVEGLSLSEKEWVLSSLPPQYKQNQRGKLFYKYYRSLSDLDNLHGEGFSPYNVDYATKPGPYNIKQSHQDEANVDDGTSLVLDFDFESGDRCVSIATRYLSDSPLDFSGVQYMEIYYKAVSGSGVVSLSVDAGTINEDSDNDGLLDTEDSNLNNVLDYDPDDSIFEDRGYLFNPSGEDKTRVGSGPRLSSETKGDGVLTSEDLNRNGTLDTMENIVSFPGTGEYASSYVEGNPSNTTLNVNLANSGWKKAVIYLDRTEESLTQQAVSCLQSVNAIRLNVESDAPVSGTIYISGISFIQSSWNDIRINDIQTDDPEHFRVSLIDSYNDSEYHDNSFMALSSNEYEQLYGGDIFDDESNPNEGALDVEYDALGGGTGSVVKTFARTLNLINYKRMQFWLNVREFTIGDVLFFRIGSSEDDYIEYQFPIDTRHIWQKLSFSLSPDSASALSSATIEGNPDLMKINQVYIRVSGNSGRFWLNNIYVSEALELTDLAYWAESELSSRSSIYRGDNGTEYGNGFSIKYIKRGVGRDFVSPGRTERNISEDAHELYSSIYPLPDLYTGMSYVRELTRTTDRNEEFAEELWGQTVRQTTIFNTAYTPVNSFMPTIYSNLKVTNYDNWHDIEQAEEMYDKQTDRNEYAPSFIIEKKFKQFLFGSLFTRATSDLLFTSHKELLDPQVADSEQTQEHSFKRYQDQDNTVSVEYSSKYFFIKPELTFGSGEYVTWRGFDDETAIDSNVEGDFHFPWGYSGKEMKYYQRSHEASLISGFHIGPFFSPEHTITGEYTESDFSDYLEGDTPLTHGYTRRKGADTVLSQIFTFPFAFTSGTRLKNLTFYYQREASLSEYNIPYEGEGTDMREERFGITRSFPASSSAYNLISYPPWIFYTGRGNFARGRDHVYNTLNNQISMGDEESLEYTNSFLVKDSYGITNFFDFTPISVSTSVTTTQLSERSDIASVPQQLVTGGCGVDVYIDLMELFSFGFFRSNGPGKNRHTAQYTIGMNYTKNMIITSNTGEDSYWPSMGITFGVNRKTLTLETSVNYMFRKREHYIKKDSSRRDSRDDIYFENLPDEKLDETDKNYNYLISYTTDVRWLFKLFSQMYRLYDFPMFTLSYELMLNRYDYTYSVSPEPYDMHLVTGELSIDVHDNIKGGITGQWALEKFRNRDSGNVYQEIISYDLLFGLALVF